MPVATLSALATGFSAHRASWASAPPPQASWCTDPLPKREPLPSDLATYDDGWIPLVERRAACSDPKLRDYGIACADDGPIRTYRFPAGSFSLSQQVWLPARVAIEGVADPNVAGQPRTRPDLRSQTLFLATSHGCDGNITTPTMGWPMPQVEVPNGGGAKLPIKCLRKGFLMASDTTVRNVNGQGLAEDGQGYLQSDEPQSYAGLNGGGFFELPGCITSYAVGGTCGRKAEPANHGEGGDHGAHFVTGTGGGRGVSNVLIEDVRLNDALDTSMDPHAGAGERASWAGFWSAMPPVVAGGGVVGGGGASDGGVGGVVVGGAETLAPGAAHTNVTLRRIVAMRTLRDGINVHGAVRGWTGEDLHFENQGDDVFAVWGAGGGAGVDQTGFSPPYAKCDLTNAPASDVVFRRTFAKGISDWSSCAHVFGASGSVAYDTMLCCSSPSQATPYPALQVAATFCASYEDANVSFRALRWYDSRSGADLCAQHGGPSPVYADASASGWEPSDLHTGGLGCKEK